MIKILFNLKLKLQEYATTRDDNISKEIIIKIQYRRICRRSIILLIINKNWIQSLSIMNNQFQFSQDQYDQDDFKMVEQVDQQQYFQQQYEIHAPILQSQSSQYSQTPILSYSYSGISNASSTPDFVMQSSRTSQQGNHNFVFLGVDKLYSSIQKFMKDITQALKLPESIVMYLLYKNQWSKQKSYENYLGCSEFYLQLNSRTLNNINSFESFGLCEVCFEENKLLSNLLCNHRYCRPCWKEYIKQQLTQNTVFFTCMNKCSNSLILVHEFVGRYFPEMFEFYRKTICRNYAKVNKLISFCPNTSNQCDLFCEKAQYSTEMCVQCQCGGYYCFSCRKQPHYPASCQDILKWEKLLNEEENNNKWIEKNTKKCPQCKNQVQKYIGCSKIKCICGAQFCYQCRGKWQENHKKNKGQCPLQQNKMSSQQKNLDAFQFIKIQERSENITRTCKKHQQIINKALSFITEERIEAKFHGIKRDVVQAWQSLKWGAIVSFIYKKSEVDSFLQQSFIESIQSLMKVIEHIYKNGHFIQSKEIISIGDQVLSRKEALQKNKRTWQDAWRAVF